MANNKKASRRSAPHSNPVKLEKPGEDDILCGKDRACALHKGSQRFRAVIDSYRSTYMKASTKYDKMQITKEIYEILSQRSRFLKYNDKEKVWEEITPLQGRDKIGHALRFANNHSSGNKKTTKKPSKKALQMVQAGLQRQDSTSSSNGSVNAHASSKAELVASLVEVAKDEPKVWDSLVDHLAHQEALAAEVTASAETPLLDIVVADQVMSRHVRVASLVDPVALENIAYAVESHTEDAALDDLIKLLNDDEVVTEEDIQDVLDMAGHGADAPPSHVGSRAHPAAADENEDAKPSAEEKAYRRTTSSNGNKKPPHGRMMSADDDMWSVMQEPLMEFEDWR